MSLSFKVLLTVGIFVVIAYLAICLLLFVKQHQFIFFPSSVIERTPEVFNLSYEDVWLPINSDGETKLIHGWWIKSPQPDAHVLLYLHGNAINVGANVGHANRFHQQGFSVLLIDYRGYGRSEGDFPNEKRVYQDAVLAWNYLVQDQQIPPGEIFIYGHSMGVRSLLIGSQTPRSCWFDCGKFFYFYPGYGGLPELVSDFSGQFAFDAAL